ncbi:MAG: hypothetical protein ABEJ70_09060 [Halobacteriaceae archaeon]
MAGRESDVDALLFEGERVEATVPVGESRVVVTSHRVLALTPGGDGANYRHADRPNVGSVTVDTSGTTDYLGPALRAAVVGVVLLGAGATVDFDGLLGATTVDAGAVPLGGLRGLLGTLRTALALFDEAALTAGALALAFGLGGIGLYVRSRERRLRVAVAGGADLTVPLRGVAAPERARDALADALATAPDRR